MPIPTRYIPKEEAFQRYYELIIHQEFINEKGYPELRDGFNKSIKPCVDILSPIGALLTTPGGTKITSYEDIKTLYREMFKSWPYYTYEELDKNGWYEIVIDEDGKESKSYSSDWMQDSVKVFEGYFKTQYKICLGRLDNIEQEAIRQGIAMQEQTNGQDAILEGFLDANHLRIGDKTPIKLPPSNAELVRFMAKEMARLKREFLELQHILACHYGESSAMNKILLAKEDRRLFDREVSSINKRCRGLIKSLGDKKYTLSIKVILPKNSSNYSPSSPYKPLKY